MRPSFESADRRLVRASPLRREPTTVGFETGFDPKNPMPVPLRFRRSVIRSADRTENLSDALRGATRSNVDWISAYWALWSFISICTPDPCAPLLFDRARLR